MTRKSQDLVILDRLPPHHIEIEQGVLGCILTEPGTCMDRCVEFIGSRADMFYDLRHKTIWNALVELHEKQSGIDTITLQSHMGAARLEGVGGVAYIMALGDATPSAANLEFYLPTLRDKWLLRRAIRVVTDGVEKLWECAGDAEKAVLDLEGGISALTEQEATRAEQHVKELMPGVVDELNEHYKRGSTQLRGLPTGPKGNYLDKLILGIREDYYTVLAGRPGDGKSSFAMNIVEFLAADYPWREKTGGKLKTDKGVEYDETVERVGIPVAIFSIEMGAESLLARMVMGRAGVSSASFKEGFATEAVFQKINSAARQLNQSNIYIDATPAQTMGQIAAKARRMKKQHGIKLFVLDYLQLVEQEGGDGDRVRELTKISRKIMALKKQLKVPWLVLAQMNRNIETREGLREPMLSDLKDSGAIEQDADVVMMLHRPKKTALEKTENKFGIENLNDIELIEQYRKEKELRWDEVPVRVNIKVAKNRHGPTGDAQMVFASNMVKFEDWRQFKLKHGYADLGKGER